MIIEHRVFRLADGVGTEEFLVLDRRLQTEVAVFEPGFVRRTTARSRDGRWLVETLWGNEEQAEVASTRTDEVSSRFAEMIDHGTLRIERFETLDQ